MVGDDDAVDSVLDGTLNVFGGRDWLGSLERLHLPQLTIRTSF